MRAIDIDGLSVSYGSQRVLFDTSLRAETGTMTCVLGQSGCGKTTLLRAIAGFEPAQTGSIRIGGTVVEDPTTRLTPERRRVGYVPQEGALFPHLTVAGNIAFGIGRARGLLRTVRSARRDRIEELLGLVGMSELASRMPHQLSGGQQQRVSVARALASEPDVVLLDEPFAALDAALRDRLRHDIRDVLRAAGVTALLVTHDRAEALSLADQVAVMRDGRIVQVGTPRQVYAQPVDAEIAAFVGDVTMLTATADAAAPAGMPMVDAKDGRPVGGSSLRSERAEAITALGSVVLAGPAGRQCQVVVRPEQIRLQPFVDDPASAVVGIVRRVEYYGHDARIDIDVEADDHVVAIVARVSGTEPYAEGDKVTMRIESPVWPLP